MRQLYAKLVFYPTLGWNVLLGRILGIRNWWDEVNEHVVLGAYPFAADVEKLSQLGIGAVVNTCHEYDGPVEQYEKYNIEQLHVPTIDFTHPSLESIETAVEFIDKQIEQGNRVYVHCKAGRARSATVVACWLIKRYQMRPVDAQKLLLSARSHVNPRLADRTVVQEFETKYLVNSDDQ